MKTWKLISNQKEYLEALNQAVKTFYAAPGTPEFEERLFLLVLIQDYEEKKIQYNYSAN